MASQPTQSISSNPARQAIFAQQKLEKIYQRTHRWLTPHKGTLELIQEVLLWKKRLISVALLVIVHWLFIVYVQSESTVITALANVLFWGLIADGLWRAASKDGFNARPEAGLAGRSRERRVPPSLETAVMISHKPRIIGEMVPFEVLCLWVSEAIMWLDNLLLALRHWSINDPIVFTCTLAVPGLMFSLVGKYIPTTVFLYIQVISLLLLPYVEHHCLRDRVVAYITAQYPGVRRRAEAFWQFLKNITVNRDRSDNPEFSLMLSDNEQLTQASLHAEFERATSRPGDRRNDYQPEQLPPPSQPLAAASPRANIYASNESLTLDSFSAGVGDFPSLTDMDSSLALPQFPTGDPVHSMMPTIAEQNEVEQESVDSNLPPIGFEFDSIPTQRRSVPRPQSNQPHPLSETHTAIQTQPSSPPIGFDGLGHSMYTSGGFETRNLPAGFVAPPTYQQVEAGSPDAGVTLDWATPEGNSRATEENFANKRH